MGLQGLWQWLRKEGIEPSSDLGIAHCPTCPSCKTIHLDLLGALFSTIKNSYSRHEVEVANAIVESAISNIGNRSILTLIV